jgi:hypothetical protein
MEWVHCHIARKPVPPSERLETVPAAVSVIILKLLAKTAEERYQTYTQQTQMGLVIWKGTGKLEFLIQIKDCSAPLSSSGFGFI